MWKALNSFGNRMWNTVAIAPRLVWTGITTSADLANTFLTLNKEAYEVVADTTQKIKSVFLWAWNHGKRYHKAMNIPLSPVIAWWTALEWWVRSVVQPVVNGVVNTRNTWKNTVKNARRSTFGRVFSKKPISDFSFDHMKPRWLKLKNRISNWQVWKWKWTSTEKKVESKETKIEKKVEMKNDEKETKVQKENENEEKDKQINQLQEKMKIIEKQNEELKENDKKMIELTKKYEELEKKDKDAKNTKIVKMDNRPEKEEKKKSA